MLKDAFAILKTEGFGRGCYISDGSYCSAGAIFKANGASGEELHGANYMEVSSVLYSLSCKGMSDMRALHRELRKSPTGKERWGTKPTWRRSSRDILIDITMANDHWPRPEVIDAFERAIAKQAS